jgi:hypothetical protein
VWKYLDTNGKRVEIPLKGVEKQRAALKRILDRAAKGLGSRVRFVPSPHEILFYAQPEDAPLIELAIGSVQLLPRVKAAHAIRLSAQKRPDRIQGYFERDDVAGLIADDWAKKFVSTSAGNGAKKTLPWPSQKEIREMLAELRQKDEPPKAEDFDPKMSPCCQTPVMFILERGGKKVAERPDKPYKIADIVRRPEADST